MTTSKSDSSRRRGVRKRVVLLEDDPFHAEYLRAALVEGGFEVVTVPTESDFVSRFSGFVNEPPDAFIVDMLLPWGDVKPEFADILQRFAPASGRRCYEEIITNEKLRFVPIVLWTALDPADLRSLVSAAPGKLLVLRKDIDPHEIAYEISRLTSRL